MVFRPSPIFLLLCATLILGLSESTSAQRSSDEGSVRMQRTDSLWYTVKGERHGVSYFPRHRYAEVEYEAGDRLSFDRFHTVDVMNTWLERWAEQYPNLIELYTVATSFEGRPIRQVTLTNRDTGKATDKPAAYFEGGRHSGEVTSSESVLWLIHYLLENYRRDPEIGRLLDTKTLYFRPQNNPDGANLYLHTLQSNRSSVRPHDSDRDGLVDEDPPEDLNGDGLVSTLRWRVREGEEDKGNAILDPRDPTLRLMQYVPEGEGDWRVVSEGIDNDGDGAYNEDGIGGLDLHRNYPENWRPEPGLDATGRGYTQGGAGAYPMSEPETRSVVMWLLEHPHVSVVNSMDTRVPMHLRGPSTAHSTESMFPEDLTILRALDEIGKGITGYPWAGDTYGEYHTRHAVNLSTGEPSRPSPLFGHGPDFGYFMYGAVWYGDELWNGGSHEDLNGDGRLDDLDALIWDDEHNGGKGFLSWEPFEHPELGLVEIGGFHPKFFAQNPPPHLLESWASRQAMFNLELAKSLPQLSWENIDIRQTGVRADTARFRVTVSWTNSGKLPTALRQAQIVKIVQEDQAMLEFDPELVKKDAPRVRIVDPATRDKTRLAGTTKPSEVKTVTFDVDVFGLQQVDATVRVRSTRGGVLERHLILSPVAALPQPPESRIRRLIRQVRGVVGG